MTHTVRLPEGWEITTLGNITVGKVEQAIPREIVPYIDISSIDRATKKIGEPREVDSENAPTRARQWVKSGDVLVSMTRPNLNAVAVVPVSLSGAVVSTGFDVLRAIEILPTWVFYRVRSHEFVSAVCKNLQGVVYPAIRPRDVRAHKLPIPPLPEQHRIVEAIELYLTRLDAAVASLERVQRNLKRYRASVLKAAAEGRLVPTEAELAKKEGRSYEPASDLLKRILDERRKKWIEDAAEKARAKAEEKTRKTAEAKYKEPVPASTTDLPNLPDGWFWVRAEQVCAFITKGTTPAKSRMSAGKGDIPFIKVYNLTFDGTLDFSINPTFVDRETHKGFLARSAVMPGDVLINIVGPPLGKTAIVSPTYSEWNINQAIARFRPMCGVIPEYLEAVLGSRFFLDWASGRSKATAGQFNLTLEICRDAPIPLPPHSEQIRITRELAVLSTIEKSIADSVDSCLVRSSRLRQSILKWAFEGKLVDQDPNDEPASVLLERIKAERESMQPRQRRRTGK